MVYYNWRYYDNSSGRFTSYDPIRDKVIDILYVFVKNQPTITVDVLGLSGLSVNDLLEIIDQTETARVKNILMGVCLKALTEACFKANNYLKKAVMKGDRKKAKEWEIKKTIICNMASDAAKNCLGG